MVFFFEVGRGRKVDRWGGLEALVGSGGRGVGGEGGEDGGEGGGGVVVHFSLLVWWYEGLG